MPYFIFLTLSVVFFWGCDAVESEPKVILGHEWNATAKVVADTTSVFKANDVIVIQLDNGKPFKAVAVELRVYQGETDRILFRRSQPVKNTDAAATVKGKDSQPMTARDILRTSTPGIYRIAFAVGDSIIAEKKMEMVK